MAPGHLHQEFVCPPGDGVLHFREIVLYPVEPMHALHKVAREMGEERCHLGIFEAIEFRNDVIAFSAGFDPVDKILQPLAAKAEVIDALREHAGIKQSTVADVFVDLTLTVKRRCGPEHRIGFDQHLTQISERSSGSITDLRQLVPFRKLGQELRYIVHDLGIANPDLLGITPADQLSEKLLQGV